MENSNLSNMSYVPLLKSDACFPSIEKERTQFSGKYFPVHVLVFDKYVIRLNNKQMC